MIIITITTIIIIIIMSDKFPSFSPFPHVNSASLQGFQLMFTTGRAYLEAIHGFGRVGLSQVGKTCCFFPCLRVCSSSVSQSPIPNGVERDR